MPSRKRKCTDQDSPRPASSADPGVLVLANTFRDVCSGMVPMLVTGSGCHRRCCTGSLDMEPAAPALLTYGLLKLLQDQRLSSYGCLTAGF
ncbi:hypothetical protein A6R68_06110 [Neotoma lepida]|uniref:Uncharacterized protein n=1 Tax=Neotoma lepida TaxID=56216 RepID=A0A1A6GGJ1_NEOLE|nr:hypothetical protein A6R68_06110 [Neotoma lepida]